MKAPWEHHWDPCYFATVSCVSPCAIPLCLGETPASLIQCRVFCFQALGHSFRRTAMFSSCPQRHLFTHLLCSELKCCALIPERKTVIFYSSAVGKPHKITASFNKLICLSIQGVKLAFSSIMWFNTPPIYRLRTKQALTQYCLLWQVLWWIRS